MDVSQMIHEALKLMGVGVGTVFFVLALFYFMIKILLLVFPEGKKVEK